MGIRGTTVLARIETVDGVVTTEITLKRDVDGSVGNIELRSLDGDLIQVIEATDTRWEVITEDGSTLSVERGPVDEANDLALITDAFTALQSAANRIAAGETFVSLPSAIPADGADGPADPDAPTSDTDVDTIDEPIIIDPDAGPGEGGNDGGGGQSQVPDQTQSEVSPLEADDVTVEGQEDAGEEGGIAGEINVDADEVLTFEIVTDPENGSADVDNAGNFTYVPDENFNGADQFTYRVTDAGGEDATGTVFVQVAAVNDAPVLPDTNTSAPEDGLVVGSLQATDVDGDDLTFTLVSGPSNGDVTLLDDGTYSYSPDPNYEGPDSFQVQVSDGSPDTDTATVLVTVTPVNDTPNITTPPGDDSGALEENGATDTASGTLTATDPDLGDVLTWTGSDTGTYGELTVNADGTWGYTLNPAAADALSDGEEVVETFPVSVQDLDAATAQSAIEIRIAGTNDRPEIVSDQVDAEQVEPVDASDGFFATGTFAGDDVDQNDALSFGFGEVTVTLRDSEDGIVPTDAPTALSTDVADALAAALTVTPDGDWTFDVPGTTFADQLPEGFTVTVATTVTASDNSNAADDTSLEQPFALTLLGTNDAPVLLSADSTGEISEPDAPVSTPGPELFAAFSLATDLAEGAEDAGLSTSGQIDIQDPDVGDSFTVAATPQASGYRGTFAVPAGALGTTVPGEGTSASIPWSFSVEEAELDDLGEGDIVTQVYRVDITDVFGGVVSQDVTITLSGSNDAPVIDAATSALSETVTEGTETLVYTGQMASDDVDIGDGATWSAVVPDIEGVLDGEGPLEGEGPPGSEGEYEGLSDVDSEGESDGEVIYGLYGTFEITAEGLWTYTLTSNLDDLNTPETEGGGSAQEIFTVQVADDTGATDSIDVIITLVGNNDGPVFVAGASTTQRSIVEDATPNSVSGQVVATDVDGPTPTWNTPDGSGSVQGSYGLLAVTTAGVWTYTLDAVLSNSLAPSDSVQETFNLVATDSSGASITQTVTVTVQGANDAPILTSAVSEETGTVTEDAVDTTTSGQLATSDPESDTVFWSIQGSGDGTYGSLSIDATGLWTYTLDNVRAAVLSDGPGEGATESFTVLFSDSQTDPNPQSVDIVITVVGNDDGPVFVAGASTTQRSIVEDATPNTVSGQMVATDVDGPTPTWNTTDGTGSVQGTYGLLAVTTAGVWTYTLDAVLSNSLAPSDSVQETFSLVATDSGGASITQTVTVTVQGANDAPILTSAVTQETGTVTEDAVVNTTSGQLSASDPEGDTVFWSIQGSVEGTYGSLSIDATGLWTYTLDNVEADVLSDGPGGGGTESFTVLFSDSQADPNPQSVDIVITVNGTDDAPIIEGELVFDDVDDLTLSDGELTATDPEGETITFAGLLGGTPVEEGTEFDTANGSISVNADGTFIYMPNDGFVGFDTFAFRASDPSGNFTDGLATIAVESGDGSGDEDNPVDVSISPEPTASSPAGSFLIDVNDVSAPEVNVIFAIDGSGSVTDFWDDILTQIDTALDTLLGTFGSSDTQVTVGFTVFSGGATQVVPFDLTLPNGIDGGPDRDGWAEELNALRGEQPAGSTNWAAALNETNTFLTTGGQGDGASNFLFFITDGVPFVNGELDTTLWPAARDALEADHDVTIEAFGIGPSFATEGGRPSPFAVDSLNALDSDRLPPEGGGSAGPPPYFTALTGANQLSDALTETPVFNPSLISLTATVDVQGDGLGPLVTVTQTTRALQSDDLDYVLAFAEIEGLADHLGVSNRFSVTAQYDLDGNTVADLTLFSTEVLGRSDTAVTVPDTGDFPELFLTGSDLLFGSDLADSIASGDGNDLIMGYGGNDAIAAGAGIDTVLAGDGDDVLSIGDLPTSWPAEQGGDGEVMDGGTGQDTLIFEFTNDISTNALDDLTIRDIEALDLTNEAENTLRLTLSDVVDLSSDANQLMEDSPDIAVEGASTMILGDALDTVFLDNAPGGSWSNTGLEADIDTGGAQGGQTFQIWQYSASGGILATVAVDDDVLVNPLPAIA